MLPVDFPRAVLRALRLIEAHDSVVDVSASRPKDSETIKATIKIKTEMPNGWRAPGQSPSGVRIIEQVYFYFYKSYPLSAPTICLRKDFDRSHPHLLPGEPDDLPQPCLIMGSPRELLRTRGILGLVEQLVEWLERAAFVQLIDPTQGWEPTRRDFIDDFLVVDQAWLTSLPNRHGGCHAFNLRYFATLSESGAADYWATLKPSEPVPIGADLTDSFRFSNGDGCRSGSAFAVIAWAGKSGAGELIVGNVYRPETVRTVDDLLARASDLGMREQLEGKLGLLQMRFRDTKMKVPVPLAVVLLPRRPCTVIGTTSQIEICPYMVELTGDDALSKGSSKVVRPAALRDEITIPLLRRASGDTDLTTKKWTLIGCGSVGSKIALHMARAGCGPSSLIDRGRIQPHNYARYALYPSETGSDYVISVHKSVLTESALAGLKQRPSEHHVDVVQHLMREKTLAPLIDDDDFAVVNTTASVAVREALASEALTGGRPRVIETCLMGEGAVGLMTVEGPGSNPSTMDLICAAYLNLYRRNDLRKAVFAQSAKEIAIGQGCSALTLPLSDARVSIFAAPMSARLEHFYHEGLQGNDGRVLVGVLKDDRMSTEWNETRVEPWIVLSQPGAGMVRISRDVDATIHAEVARCPDTETGGIVFGRYCDLTDSFHVVGALPAPPDSKFSVEEFVLGTNGLRPMLLDLIEGSGGALYPLGTWHSHLIPSGPSPTDMRTAVLLSGKQYFPLLMLIHTPSGYVTLTAETVQGLSDGDIKPAASTKSPEEGEGAP